MKKDITFHNKARTGLINGIKVIANAVGATLGPKGRNVVIEKSYGAPHVTKDGVTVAGSVVLEDAVENLGAQILKQAAAKTVKEAGDGTTTSIVLAQKLVEEAHRQISNGANPIDIKRGMEQASKEVVKKLQEYSVPVNDDFDKIEQIATISANNDVEIGQLIRQAFEAVGKDGIVAVEESKSVDTFVNKSEGMQFDRGFISPYFANNAKGTCEFEDPYVLIYDKKIRGTGDIVPILEKVAQKQKPILIIAEEVEAQALTLLVLNKMQRGAQFCAVKAPAFGDRRRKVLQDIATVTGGTLISETVGRTLEDVTLADLGRAEKIQITKDDTTIIRGAGSPEEIAHRIEQVKNEINTTESEYELSKTKERLAKLVGGVAVLHIGAATEVELTEKKDRVEDALKATQAALEEGILPGAGSSYIAAAQDYQPPSILNNRDQLAGVRCLEAALEQPLRIISENAGRPADLVLSRVKEAMSLITHDELESGDGSYAVKFNQGFDANNGSIVDLREHGIIDPTKVVRVALENAVSVAGMLLMTEVTVTEKEELNLDIPGGMPPPMQ